MYLNTTSDLTGFSMTTWAGNNGVDTNALTNIDMSSLYDVLDVAWYMKKTSCDKGMAPFTSLGWNNSKLPRDNPFYMAILTEHLGSQM